MTEKTNEDVKKSEIPEQKPKLNVFQKLQKVRVALQKKSLKKSGRNTYAKYDYYVLGDILPAINELCDEYGLTPLITYAFNETEGSATLTIVDSDNPTGTPLVFTTPSASAQGKGQTPIQNIGATETYCRRYLYLTAFEIDESDYYDAVTEKEESKSAKSAGSKTQAQPQSDELVAVKKEIITMCTKLGGSENNELMTLLRSYVPSGNPNAFKEVKTAKECLNAIKKVKPLKA